MKSLEEIVKSRTDLKEPELAHLQKLSSDWQLIADLSFADLALWIPTKDSEYMALSHVRAATAATVFPKDFEGELLKELPNDLSVDSYPISFKGKVVAQLTRHRNPQVNRSLGRLESTYQEIAQQLIEMVGEGLFPFEFSISSLNPSPRIGDGFIRLDRLGVITYASPNGRSAFSRLGWEGELEGIRLIEVANRISGESISNLTEKINSSDVSQVVLESRGGVVELTILPLLKSSLRTGGVVLLHNVTEIRRRERELLLKDATIREIHHRVKNNLQTVSALLRLQSRRVEDLTAQGALNEAVRRISSIALVHETLSASGQDLVDFDAVVDSLISHAVELAVKTPINSHSIKIKRLGSIGSLDPKVATPLSLIITELIANAVEHGITSKGESVDVIFSRTGNSCVVKVEDDGVGLPDDFNLASSSNLGLQIVRTLTENELNGTLEITNRHGAGSGTSAQVHFEIRN